jgi:phospholipid/cholesterol/gamma-HCH transport system permease protein
LPFELRDEGGRQRLQLDGRWTVAEAAALEPRLGAVAPAGSRELVIDAAAIEVLDLAGAWLLRALERRLK